MNRHREKDVRQEKVLVIVPFTGSLEKRTYTAYFVADRLMETCKNVSIRGGGEIKTEIRDLEAVMVDGDVHHCQHLAMMLFDKLPINNDIFSNIIICKTFDLCTGLCTRLENKDCEVTKIEIDFTQDGVYYDYEY